MARLPDTPADYSIVAATNPTRAALRAEERAPAKRQDLYCVARVDQRQILLQKEMIERQLFDDVERLAILGPR